MLARVLISVCVIIATALPAFGQKPTFGELLARAQAQAAAGHRWTPPGDNMTETVVSMMDLIPTATAEELAQLSALLETDKARTEPLPNGAVPVEPMPAGPMPMQTKATPTAPSAVPPVSAPSAAVARSDAKPAAPPAADPATVPVRPNPPSAARVTGAMPVRPATSDTGPTPAVPPRAARSATDLAVPNLVMPDLAVPSAGAPRPARPAMDKTAAVDPTLRIPNLNTPVPARPGPPAAPGPSPRAVELFGRGEQAERHGDVSGARRYYASAAQQGHATAARNLGRLYDPAYLRQTALGGIAPDPAMARRWYEQAMAMGDAEARPLLEALSLR